MGIPHQIVIFVKNTNHTASIPTRIALCHALDKSSYACRAVHWKPVLLTDAKEITINALQSNMKRFLLFIIALISISCSQKSANQNTKEINVGDGREFEAIQDRISDVRYLPLETNDNCLFANAEKVLFRDGMIYVGDYANSSIHVFDSDGSHKLTLKAQGRGPGEYFAVNSFTVDREFIDVLDLVQLKMHRYDRITGQFAESRDLPVYAFDVEALDNGDFIFCYVPLYGAGTPIQQTSHRVFITDSELNVKDRMIEYSENKFDLIGAQRYFSVSDDRIALFCFQDDGYVVFDKKDGRIIETVHLDFSNPIPENARYDQSALASGYSFIVASPFLCGTYASFMARIGDGGGIFEYDHATGILLSNAEQKPGSFLLNLVGSHDGAFVSLLANGSSYYDALLEKGFQKADPASETAIRRNDPVLVFFQMK